MFDETKGVLGNWKGIEFNIVDIPKPNDNQVLVVKFDCNIYELETCSEIYSSIIKSLSEDSKIIGLATGIDLTCEDIDEVINHLKELKEQSK